MPKLHGQVQRYVPSRTMSDMVQDMANTLSNIGDGRFERFWKYMPIAAAVPWFRNSKRVNVLVGATKSTKSTIGVFKAIMVFTQIVPPQIQAIWNHAPRVLALNRERHVRIVVQNYTDHWPETIKPLLLSEEWGMLPAAWASNYDDNEHMFYGPDGSFLKIIAVDPKKQVNPNTLRGPLMDHTYIDELSQRMVYTESMSRDATLADGPRTVDLGFCPQEGYDWTYEDLYLTGYNRNTDEQLPEEERAEDINVLRLTMRDNPSIGQVALDQYIRLLKPWEIAYRVEGKYTARAGDPYFDMYQMVEWEKTGRQTHGVPYVIERGHMNTEEGEFEGNFIRVEGIPDEERENVWRIWEVPKDHHYYVMTVDTAEGHPKSDFQVCDIWRCSQECKTSDGKTEIKIDVNRPVQVAQFRKRVIKPGDFIIECCLAASIYGDILMVYEVNNTSGGTVRDRSRGYTNLYKRFGPNKKELTDDTEYIGWWTDQHNKPTALEEAYHMFQDWKVSGYCGINSPETLADMMCFEERVERDEEKQVSKRSFGAKQGGFDDCITTLFQMAYVLRFQNSLLTESVISDTKPVDNYVSPLEEEAERLQRENTGSHLRKQPSLTTLARGHHAGRNEGRGKDNRNPGEGRRVPGHDRIRNPLVSPS